MTTTHPNRHLIGVPGSLWKLETPALVLDLDALESNIATAAAIAAEHKIALRPHAKTHKSARIAKMQMEAGALGVCVQTVGEAEALAAAGVPAIHVASVTASPAKMDRIAAMRRGGCDVTAVVDHEENVSRLALAARSERVTFDVLVQIDTGKGREGVNRPEDAAALARRIAAEPSLRCRGFQAYAGWVQHIVDYEERQAAAANIRDRVREIRGALRAAGIDPEIITGAGTGSIAIDAAAGVYTELQPGSYVFMDAEYQQVHKGDAGGSPFATALHVLVSVTSNHIREWVTTDGGIKAFAMDKGPPLIAQGAPPGSTYVVNADEAGRVMLPVGAEKPALGQRILCVTPHCDPTVNLYDWYHCVRSDQLVDLWPIDARGRSL